MTVKAVMLNGGETAIDKERLDNLRTTVRGAVLTPGDPGYDAVRPVYNAMHPGRPAVVVQATGTADVIDAINFARQQGLLLAVRGGGHSVAGLSSVDGGVLLNLALMNRVDVDPDAKLVRAHGGALWRDVDRETQVFGLATPGGIVSDTGIAGLTLGGGEGWMRRKLRVVVRQPCLRAGRRRQGAGTDGIGRHERRPLLGNPRRRRQLWGRDVVHLQSTARAHRGLRRLIPANGRRLACSAGLATSSLNYNEVTGLAVMTTCPPSPRTPLQSTTHRSSSPPVYTRAMSAKA